MTTVPIEVAQARLAELIARLQPGDEIMITVDDRPVARLVATELSAAEPRRLGSLQGQVAHMAEDFDKPLEEFPGLQPVTFAA